MIGTPFIPFYGFVEDVNDPEKLGRVRVRVVSYHSENKSELPTDQLKWFMCVVNNSESQNGIGTNPKYNIGSMVFGYFIDQTLQNGMIIGSLNGMPDGINDINKLARNEDIDQTIVQQKKDSVLTGVNVAGGGNWSEPETPYNTQYPHNKVTQSNSGHVTECDDTQGAERLHLYHRSGSFYELHPDGSQVVRIIKDNYTITAGDNFLYVDGDVNMSVGGNLNQHVAGNYNLQVDGTMTQVVMSDLKQKVAGSKTTLASGGFAVDAPTIDLNSGVASGNGSIPVILPTEYTIEFAAAIIKSAGRFAALDEESEIGSTPSNFPDDAKPSSFTGEAEVSDKKSQEKEVDLIQCSTNISKGLDYNKILGSTDFTIGDLSKGAVFSHNIQAQGGLSEQEIVCNLEALATHIIQPLKNKFGSFTINSGFRVGAGKSQHTKGQALDIQNSNWSPAKYLEVAEWIADNLPYDQNIIEHGVKNWLHISFDSTKTTQRGQLLTMLDGKYESGLRQYYS